MSSFLHRGFEDEMPPFGSCFIASEKHCACRGCKRSDISWTAGKGSWAEDNCWYLTKSYVRYHSEQMSIDSFFSWSHVWSKQRPSKHWSGIIYCWVYLSTGLLDLFLLPPSSSTYLFTAYFNCQCVERHNCSFSNSIDVIISYPV